MAGLDLGGGGDAEAVLQEILEYLEAREGNSLKDALAPKPEAGGDIAAALGAEPAAEAKPCPVCGKAPCECAQGA